MPRGVTIKSWKLRINTQLVGSPDVHSDDYEVKTGTRTINGVPWLQIQSDTMRKRIALAHCVPISKIDAESPVIYSTSSNIWQLTFTFNNQRFVYLVELRTALPIYS